MSDTNGNNENAKPEAEVLGPEKAGREPRPRKEPPVIDGEAEVLASSMGGGASGGGTGSGPQSSASSSSAEKPSGTPAASRPGGLGTIALALILAIVAAGAISYIAVSRLSHVADETAAGLGERIQTLEQKSQDSGRALAETTQKLDQRLAAAEQTLAAQSPDSIAAVNARLDKLATETDALKQSLAEAQTASQASQQKLDEISKSMPPAGIADQVAKIEAMLRLLNGALDQLTPKIAGMEQRLAALEAKKEDPDAAARAALGLALANLARAAEGPGPFRSELDAVGAFLPNEPELKTLDAAATHGVPTRAWLRQDFPTVTQSIFDAERRASGDGLWARFVSNIRSVVTVRRIGEISGDTTEALVARMEERLKADDLAGAVAEGGKLKGAAAEAAKSWLDEARDRVATDQLVRDLTAHVAARLTKAAGETPAGRIGD